MATVVSTNFDAKFHRVPFRAATMEGMEAIQRVHGAFLNVIQTNNLTEMEYLYYGLPAVPKREGELKRLPRVGFGTSKPVGYTQEMYGMQYIYLQRAAKYDKTGIITDVLSSMGEGAAYSIEILAAALLNESTTRVGGIDTQPLASRNHRTSDGRRYSNITTAGGPNQATLATIYNYARNGVRNDMGRVVPLDVEVILVAPELVPAWRSLVGDNTIASQPNPAVTNPYRGLITPDKIQESVYLTGTYDTHVLFRGHRLNMFVAENPRTRTWNDEELEAIHHAIQFECIVGFTDARRYLYIPGY